VQDGNGILWGFSGNYPNHLYRFDGKTWSDQVAPFPTGENAKPQEIAKLADGSVACLWRLPDNKVSITRHTEAGAVIWGTCDGSIITDETATMLPDSQNRLWITGRFPAICRADEKNGIKIIHQIQPEEVAHIRFIGDRSPAPFQGKINCKMIHCMEDGEGRIWAWSDWADGRSDSQFRERLRGILLFVGDKTELVQPEFLSSEPNIPSFPPGVSTEPKHLPKSFLHPEEPINCKGVYRIVKADSNHMWVSVAGLNTDELYKVNIDSLLAEKLSPPAPNELVVWNNDLLGVDRSNILWKYHNEKWEKIYEGLDSWPPNQYGWREWLGLTNGLLVPSSGNGALFVLKEGKPIRLSWKNGFDGEFTYSFAYFSNGVLFALCKNQTFFCAPFALPPQDKIEPRIHQYPAGNWLIGADGSPWTILDDSKESISNWKDGKWVHHPMPYSLHEGFSPDPEGRIWLPPILGNRPTPNSTQVYDPHTEQWQSFSSLEEAFIQLKVPPSFLLVNQSVLSPQYSVDHNRIAFRASESQPCIKYYDGFKWTTLNRLNITGNMSDGSMGAPWFNKEDKLCINMPDKTTWQMDENQKWSKILYQDHPSHENEWKQSIGFSLWQPPTPEGCITDRPDSIVMDNHGVCWLTWQGALYKSIEGHCVKVFGQDEVTPFAAIRYDHLFHANVDSKGNALLSMGYSSLKVVGISPKSHPPQTSVIISREGEDTIRANFDAHSSSKIEFRWQLDNYPEQVSSSSTLTLEGLPNGAHTLRVSALDEELQSDSAPALSKFSIKIDPIRQIEELVTRLSNPDYDRRKSAVNALSLQPALALPALKKARFTADDDKKWWIDAALQKINGDAKK
jgi:hypothetical protein